nr:DNA-directed RNA polymerase subunit alpha C-terminal domain-containing protein [Enterobacter sp. JMULE2]
MKLGLTVREAFTVVIEELGLTVRTLNALRRHRITTLDELSGRLSSLSGMLGKKRYHEIRNAIETQQERRS